MDKMGVIRRLAEETEISEIVFNQALNFEDFSFSCHASTIEEAQDVFYDSQLGSKAEVAALQKMVELASAEWADK